MNRRLLTALTAGYVFFLASCASGGNTNTIWTDYFEVMKRAFSGAFSDQAVTRDTAAAIPYASLGYRINGGAESILVLATDTGGDLLWTSAAHIVLLTRDGRILRTVGLSHDVSGIVPAIGNSLPPPAAVLKGAFTSARIADYTDLSRYSVPINCKMASAGREIITILGEPIETLHAVEDCKSGRDWSFRDSFWLTPDTGFVWRSIQHLNPKGDTIEIEILRPPGS